jgi:hypothetical protein
MYRLLHERFLIISFSWSTPRGNKRLEARRVVTFSIDLKLDIGLDIFKCNDFYEKKRRKNGSDALHL